MSTYYKTVERRQSHMKSRRPEGVGAPPLMKVRQTKRLPAAAATRGDACRAREALALPISVKFSIVNGQGDSHRPSVRASCETRHGGPFIVPASTRLPIA
eukprot:7121283-Prymnesium_polylepis.1